MRIGYCKVGRAIHLDPRSFGMQGDPAAPQLIRRLATRNPQHTFVVASKSDHALEHLPPNCEEVWEDGQPRAQWRYTGPGKPLEPIPEGLAYEREVVVPAIEALDGLILDWGQHGTSHMFIPQTPKVWAEAEASFEANGRVHTDKCPCHYTHPHAWARQYGASVMNGANALQERLGGRAPTVHIVEDNRNYIKSRDLKWPNGTEDILALHTLARTCTHERFRDPRTQAELGYEEGDRSITQKSVLNEVDGRHGELWLATHRYRHGGVELMILPDDWADWGTAGFDDRTPAGIGTTSFWVGNPEERRSRVVLDFLKAAFPEAPVYGKFDKKCIEEAGFTPIENDASDFGNLLSQWRVSLALPSISRMKEGGTWATGKPVQLWAARTAAFFIGPLDAQGWLLPSRRHVHPSQAEVAPGLWSVRGGWTDGDITLARWLRVETPEEFRANATVVATDRATWKWIVHQQRDILQRRWDEALTERTIEFKLGL